MPSLADSNADYVPDRVWPQHQAALTLIKHRIEDPNLTSFSWLDLACGRGQILANIGRVLSKETCAKIRYEGFDVVQEFCLKAEQLANTYFLSARIQVSEIDKFELLLEPDDQFDVVTLTNTVHEISPQQVAGTLVSALSRANPSGILFMYDMESLPNLELGAVPWQGAEIEQILHCLLRAAGETSYLPTVATWPHKSCVGWHLQVNRGHIQVSGDDLKMRRGQMLEAATNVIRALLEKRLLDVHQALTALSRYGSGSGEETLEIQRLTYDYWAISRALGGPLIVSATSQALCET